MTSQIILIISAGKERGILPKKNNRATQCFEESDNCSTQAMKTTVDPITGMEVEIIKQDSNKAKMREGIKILPSELKD